MPKNNSRKKFKKKVKLSVQILIYLTGASLLVAASISSVLLTDLVFHMIYDSGFGTIGKYIFSGVVLAICIIIIGAVISEIIGSKVVNLMSKSAKNLNEANDLFFGNDKKSGALNVAKDIVELHNKSKNIDNILISTDSFEKIQENFFKITKISEINEVHLYIVGTMIGTFHTNSLELAEQLKKLAEINEGKPFNKSSFCSPGHLNTNLTSSTERIEYLNEAFKSKRLKSLYPFASRLIAGKILLRLWEYYRESEKGKQSSNEEVICINLYFVERSDIFPAIQLWSNEAAMILPSASYSDRKNEKPKETNAVNEAMPVALVFRKNYDLKSVEDKKCNLSGTLKRLEEYLKQDYNMDETKNKPETWELNTHTDTCTISNYIDLFEQSIFKELIDSYMSGNEKSTIVKNIIDNLIHNNRKEFTYQEFSTFINNFFDIMTNITDFNNQKN